TSSATSCRPFTGGTFCHFTSSRRVKMYVVGSGFSTFAATSGSAVYHWSSESSPSTVLKRISRLYEYDASACVRKVDAFIGSLPSTRLTVPRSVPPGCGFSPPVDGLLPAEGVLSLSLLLLHPTSAIAPADAPPTAAACNARRLLMRCFVIRSQYEVAMPIELASSEVPVPRGPP